MTREPSLYGTEAWTFGHASDFTKSRCTSATSEGPCTACSYPSHKMSQGKLPYVDIGCHTPIAYHCLSLLIIAYHCLSLLHESMLSSLRGQSRILCSFLLLARRGRTSLWKGWICGKCFRGLLFRLIFNSILSLQIHCTCV